MEFRVTSRLAAVLSQVFGLHEEQISIELTKDDVSSWDSLRQMDLVMSIESEFGITLEISDIINMDSVANIIIVIQNKGIDLGN